ncbi:glycosyltransferase family 2 protein [Anaerolineales bacterium HSG24]|nr:glycosyltransferase family 2 protein [Anaerolineales bacterium HSG24]
MSDKPNLTMVVVIPAYRCADQLRGVLDSIPTYINHIIVVDDASPDDIYSVVSGIDDSRLNYIRHTHNQGVGGAMLTGYNRALELGATIIIKMDGDGQMDPDFIPALITPIIKENADYTKGNRFLVLTDLRQMPKMRFFGNLGLTFLTKLASGYWHIFDPNNGFTAIHHHCLNSLNKSNIHQRYFFESSLLIELYHQRAVVLDIPMPARYGDEKSSLSMVRTAFEFPYNLLKGFVKRVLWQYYLYDFSAVSLFIIMGILLSGFGTLWGGYVWYVALVEGIPRSAGTVMLGVLPFILGFQLLLQALVLDIRNIPKVPLQQKKHIYSSEWLEKQRER